MSNKPSSKPSASIMSDKGVTLVEVMIALVVLLIVFMGLLQASVLSVEHNLRNELRDEAVRVASDRINALRVGGFTNAALTKTYDPPAAAVYIDDTPKVVTRRFRNIVPDAADPKSLGHFELQKAIFDITDPITGDTNVKSVALRISWQYKGEALNHTVNATIHR